MLKNHFRIYLLIIICLILFVGCAIVKENRKKKCKDCPDWSLLNKNEFTLGREEKDRNRNEQQGRAVLNQRFIKQEAENARNL